MGGSGLAAPLAAHSALPRSADRLLGLAMRARWSSTCKLASPSPTCLGYRTAPVHKRRRKEHKVSHKLAAGNEVCGVAWRQRGRLPRHANRGCGTSFGCRENELRRWVGRSGGSMTTTQETRSEEAKRFGSQLRGRRLEAGL